MDTLKSFKFDKSIFNDVGVDSDGSDESPHYEQVQIKNFANPNNFSSKTLNLIFKSSFTLDPVIEAPSQEESKSNESKKSSSKPSIMVQQKITLSNPFLGVGDKKTSSIIKKLTAKSTENIFKNTMQNTDSLSFDYDTQVPSSTAITNSMEMNRPSLLITHTKSPSKNKNIEKSFRVNEKNNRRKCIKESDKKSKMGINNIPSESIDKKNIGCNDNCFCIISGTFLIKPL